MFLTGCTLGPSQAVSNEDNTSGEVWDVSHWNGQRFNATREAKAFSSFGPSNAGGDTFETFMCIDKEGEKL